MTAADSDGYYSLNQMGNAGLSSNAVVSFYELKLDTL
jgi:hypothetical protein